MKKQEQGRRGAQSCQGGKRGRGTQRAARGAQRQQQRLPLQADTAAQQPEAHPAPPTVPLRTESAAVSTIHTRIYGSAGAPTNSANVNPQDLSVGVASSEGNREEMRVKVKLALPSFGYKELDADDLDLVTILRQIAVRYNVNIALPTDDGTISINAQSKFRAHEAIQAIFKALESQADDSKAWHPQILIGPPTSGKDHFEARLEKAPDGSRPILSPSTTNTSGPDNDELEPLTQGYQDAFCHKMFQIAGSLRSNPNEMQMGVYFGTLRLQEWKKDKDTYSFDDLEILTRRISLRGTFKLDGFLGSDRFNEDLMTKIYSSENFFEPITPRIPDLKDVPARHTLMLKTAGLDLETEVIGVLDNDRATTKYRLGPVHGFRREKRHQAVEIVTSCPESRYDWDLEVRTQVKVDSLPFNRRELEVNTRFKAKEQNHSFPDVVVLKDFATRSKLEGVMGKTTWVFRIRGTPYLVEVSLFRKWEGPSTNAPAVMGSGVTMRGVGWDEELGPKNIAEGLRQWSDNFNELFPDVDRKDDGLEVFFRCVKEVQDILGEVAEFQYVED